LAVRLCDHVDALLRDHEVVLIEGLRGTAEHAVFTQRWGATYRTVAIVAEDEVRFQRIQQRGRSEDGDRAAFEARNAREIGWGLDRLIAEANDVLDNNQPLAGFKAACAAWMAEHF